MSYTATASQTTTMTEARVGAVMQKVSANLASLVVARHLAPERAKRWQEDLTYLQVAEALEYFEIQILAPGGQRFGLRYTVSADGSLRQDSASGGLDPYGIPPSSTLNLYAHPRGGQLSATVRQYLVGRGWGFNGSRLEAQASEPRAFSADGYGLTRVKLGTWP